MAETYTVEIHHEGDVHTIQVPEDETVLAAAKDEGFELPNSCNAGVCTTCAAKVLEGIVNQDEGMGIAPEIIEQGYALLCVSYPRSDLKVETGKEDVVYELQFGQHQK